MQDRTVPKRQYTEEFKIEAARLGESVGCMKRHAGWACR